MLIFLGDLAKMDTAIKLMVINVKYLFTMRKFTFPAFRRCLYFFNVYPFFKKSYCLTVTFTARGPLSDFSTSNSTVISSFKEVNAVSTTLD